jgi:hypothetical protein
MKLRIKIKRNNPTNVNPAQWGKPMPYFASQRKPEP